MTEPTSDTEPGQLHNELQRNSQPTTEIAGKLAVLAMLGFGLLAVALIYTFWHYQSKPFRELTEVLGRTYRHSLPKVAGGKPKHGPTTLRIVMRVPFDPNKNDEASLQRVDETIAFARKHSEIDRYEIIEIHLVHMPAQSVGGIRVFKRIAPEFKDSPPDPQL